MRIIPSRKKVNLKVVVIIAFLILPVIFSEIKVVMGDEGHDENQRSPPSDSTWSEWRTINFTDEYEHLGGGVTYSIVNDTYLFADDMYGLQDDRFAQNPDSTYHTMHNYGELIQFRGQLRNKVVSVSGSNTVGGGILTFDVGGGSGYSTKWDSRDEGSYGYIQLRQHGTSTSRFDMSIGLGSRIPDPDVASTQEIDNGGAGYVENTLYWFLIDLNRTGFSFTIYSDEWITPIETAQVNITLDAEYYSTVIRYYYLWCEESLGNANSRFDFELFNVQERKMSYGKLEQGNMEDLDDYTLYGAEKVSIEKIMNYDDNNGSGNMVHAGLSRTDNATIYTVKADSSEYFGKTDYDKAYAQWATVRRLHNADGQYNRFNIMTFSNASEPHTYTDAVNDGSIFQIGILIYHGQDLVQTSTRFYTQYVIDGVGATDGFTYNASKDLANGMMYYIKMEWNGTYHSVGVYSDANLTVMVAYNTLDLSGSLSAPTYCKQYMIIQSIDQATGYDYHHYGIVCDFQIGELEGAPDAGGWIGGIPAPWSFDILTPSVNTSLGLNGSTAGGGGAGGTPLIDNWLYMGEVYNIVLVGNNTDYAEINFTDGEHVIYFRFYNSSKRFEVITDDELVVGLINTEYVIANTIGNDTQTTLLFTFILDKNIVDYDNCIFYYEIQNRTGHSASGYSATVYNIYNLGGKVYYTYQGDGTRVSGGDAFELEATNGTDYSNATAYVVFRKLQNLHMLFTWDLDSEMSGVNLVVEHGGYVKGGFDYRLNGSWVSGWYYVINIDEAEVGTNYGGSGYDASNVRLQVKWFNRDALIKTDFIYAYHEGYDKSEMPTERNVIRLWADLWFNKMNASTVVGGRVNSYYYGMKELGTWWFGYGDFRPVKGNTTASTFFDELQNENGEVINCKQIELVRAWVQVRKIPNVDTDDDTWRLKEYTIMNWITADDRMIGIDTPVFVETKEVTMPQTGFLQPLYQAINNIGKAVTNAIFNVAKMMIGAIDSFLVFLGLPAGTFSSLANMISIQFTTMVSWLESLTAQVANMLLVFGYMINTVVTYVGYVINTIVWVATNVIGLPVHMIRFIIAIINGTDFTYMGNTWNLTGDYVSILNAGKQMLPYTITFGLMFWLFTGNYWGEGRETPEQIPRRVVIAFGYLKELYQNVFWVFNRIKNELIEMYNWIRSHIPSLGGGGGTTQE